MDEAIRDIIKMQRKHDAEIVEELARSCAELDDEIEKLEENLENLREHLKRMQNAYSTLCSA